MLTQGEHGGEIRVGSHEHSAFRSCGPHDVRVRRAEETDVGDVDCVMAQVSQTPRHFRGQVGVE
jgi:hypothetical protein